MIGNCDNLSTRLLRFHFLISIASESLEDENENVLLHKSHQLETMYHITIRYLHLASNKINCHALSIQTNGRSLLYCVDVDSHMYHDFNVQNEEELLFWAALCGGLYYSTAFVLLQPDWHVNEMYILYSKRCFNIIPFQIAAVARVLNWLKFYPKTHTLMTDWCRRLRT